jgi:hypothetical protein
MPYDDLASQCIVVVHPGKMVSEVDLRTDRPPSLVRVVRMPKMGRVSAKRFVERATQRSRRSRY